MKLVTAEARGRAFVGALLPDREEVVDFAAAAKTLSNTTPEWTMSMQSLIEGGQAALDAASEIVARPPEDALRSRTETKLLAPLPRPVRIRDCALFTEHLEAAMEMLARAEAAKTDAPDRAYRELIQSKFKLPELFFQRVLYYTVDPMSVSGPEQEIDWPRYSAFADFELEWAAVVGRNGTDVAKLDAGKHIFGYTIFNDWSARDEQMKVMPAGVGPGGGKDFDGSLSLGPCIATADEFPDPYNIQMRALLNGEVLTSRSSSSMRFTFEDAIVELSRSRSIYAGDVIGSGTVLGGCAFEHGRRLADGDLVELEVEGIGTLRNRVRISHLRSAT